jgi:rSAM/selenodomain-associated transferase 2/rSAM/selenodomain-associated transferase 1
VKTRLAASLGDEAAARLHAELARFCLDELRPLAATGEARIVVHLAAEAVSGKRARRDARGVLGPGTDVELQPEGDLGDRIGAAMQAGFARGASVVAAVGSDCPGLDATVVRDVPTLLEECDCVLGPATDGGYYLIALRVEARETLRGLLEGVDWGTDAVLAQTLGRAEDAGLRVALLRELADIDRLEDLSEWDRVRAESARSPDADVSVIIPALDEEATVAAAVGSALEAGADEVIVVDGGSADDTADLAREAGATLATSGRGRARQMNAGAALSGGRCLLFLHADTLLPPDAAAEVRRALEDPSAVAGAFMFDTIEEGAAARLIAGIGQLRIRLSRHPYGDHAIFVDARTFRLLGGFPEIPVMEDWELVRRLRRLGHIEILSARAPTSARSFLEQGVVRTTAVNGAIIPSTHRKTMSEIFELADRTTTSVLIWGCNST